MATRPPRSGVHALIAARGYPGEIGICCSNAGITAGTGPDGPGAGLAAILEVNEVTPRAGVALAGAPGGSPAWPDDCHPIVEIAIYPDVVWLAARSLRAHSASRRGAS